VNKLEKNILTWGPAGPLHYGMSLEDMEDAIKLKFKEMAESGHLMTEEFYKTHCDDREYYHLAGADNLTRIWGAEYLNSHLENIQSIKAVQHYLIVLDEIDEIEVEVKPVGDYPVLASVKNAYILSKKVEPIPEESECKGILSLYGYKDLHGDAGNVLVDAQHMSWVVDTEFKSFDRPSNINNYSIFEYLNKRFGALTDYASSLSFKISKKDLGFGHGKLEK
jgi:hypothetical protein